MIDQLIHEEKELLIAIHENRVKQRNYNTKMFCKKYGIKIGDTIKFKDGKDIITGVISKFEYSGVKPNYPVVLLFNQDGKVGKREKRCWLSSLETIEVVKSI